MGAGPVQAANADYRPVHGAGPIQAHASINYNPAFSSGSITSSFVDFLGSGFAGPINDHLADPLPMVSSGPVDDHLADPLPQVSSGPVVDHFAERVPDFSSGALSDSIVGVLNRDAAGALLDWAVVTIPGPFNPNDPSRSLIPETKIPPPRDVRCTGSGGDGSPGVCGRGD
jgi:hypothetical protein